MTYLNRLDSEGLLDKSEDYDFGLCMKIAAANVGTGFAGELRSSQSPIAKEFVWRIFRELGLVVYAKEQQREARVELAAADAFTNRVKREEHH